VRLVKGLVSKDQCAGSYLDGIIEIDPDISPDAMMETLIHECIHAWEDVNDCNLGEKRVRSLGFGLYSLLKPFLFFPF
jgi:hypothetical protein